jgi:nitroreductase
MVTDPAIKEELSQRTMIGPGNQFRCKDCSALAVFLSDLEAGKRITRIAKLEKDWGHRHPSYLATLPIATAFMLGEGHAATLFKQLTMDTMSLAKPMPSIEPISVWASKNTAIMVQQYILAATSHNLATSLMEGIDPRRMKEVLDIPDRYSIPMVAATGYEWSQAPKNEVQTPRLDVDEVVFRDKFGVGWQRREDDHASDLTA